MTTRVNILREIRRHGPACPTETIRTVVLESKQVVSYHLLHLIEEGYVQRGPTGSIATWTITEAGSKFVDMNEGRASSGWVISLENARFLYRITKAGIVEVDSDVIRLNNWAQVVGREGPVFWQKNPHSLTLIVGKLIGPNPWKLLFEAEHLANEVAKHLEQRLGIGIGLPKFLGFGRGKAHFEVSGNPIAEVVSEYMVVSGEAGSLGDRSHPHTRGSVSLYDPRKVDDYLKIFLSLPALIGSNQEKTMKGLSEIKDELTRLHGYERRPIDDQVRVMPVKGNHYQMEGKVAYQREGQPPTYSFITRIIPSEQSGVVLSSTPVPIQ